MTKVIDLAKQCGIVYYLTPEGTTEMHGTDRQIEAFAELVAEEEREARAKAVEAIEVHDVGHPGTAFAVQGMCVEVIRARGNKGEVG